MSTMSTMTMTTTTKYTHGIYADGLREWKKESAFDRLTSAPRIIAIAHSEESAQQWIDTEMARQERTIAILPGQGSHYTYSIIALDDDAAYLSKQNLRQGWPVEIGLQKKALVSNPKVAKI